MSNEDIKKEKAAAVGHIPSGLFIITAKSSKDNHIDGFLGSWVQQISFDPLLVTLAVKPGRPACDLILSGDVFTINVVGDHDKNYLKHFWQGYDPENSPFDELPFHEGKNGGIILDAAKSAIECKLVSSSTPGDHQLVVAEVLASEVISTEGKSMTHTRKSGLDY